MEVRGDEAGPSDHPSEANTSKYHVVNRERPVIVADIVPQTSLSNGSGPEELVPYRMT
jgi:hypothetical protein